MRNARGAAKGAVLSAHFGRRRIISRAAGLAPVPLRAPPEDGCISCHRLPPAPRLHPGWRWLGISSKKNTSPPKQVSRKSCDYFMLEPTRNQTKKMGNQKPNVESKSKSKCNQNKNINKTRNEIKIEFEIKSKNQMLN